MRALLVLDASPTRELLEDYLGQRGFVLTTCQSSVAAHEASQTHRHPLIILDRLLPDGDGLDLVRTLRKDPTTAKSVVLVLTVSAQPEDLREVIGAGADDYLVVPMDPELLVARLFLAEKRVRLVNQLLERSEEGVQTESDLFKIADSSPVMLWLTTEDGTCIYFNRSYLNFTGRALEQEQGMGWTEGLHPEDYSRCLDTYLTGVRKQDEMRCEYRLRAHDGEYRWVLSAGVPRYDSQGEFIGYIGSCVDISEHKRSEAVLRGSEERLRLVVRNMPVMMVAFDDAQQIIVWNRECERVTGFRAEEIIRNPDFMELLAPAHDDPSSLLRQWAAPPADYRNWEMEIHCRGGVTRSVAWSNISEELKIPGWTSWGVGVDVTERKSAELERRQLEAQIQKAQKLESLGILAGGVAHDFNNLLVSILGKTNLARMELDPATSAHELLLQVEQAAQSAAELTGQMLAYSGKGKFLVRSVNLSQVVRGVKDRLAEIREPGTEIAYELDDDLPCFGGDTGQIEQVVTNLFTNGAEAIDGSGRIVIRTGKLYADRRYLSGSYLDDELPEGRYCFLELSDDGCGISADLAGKIFDPFYTTKFTGRGLGLAAVLGIVRGHGGAVRVDSVAGEGTTVVALFPVSTVPVSPSSDDNGSEPADSVPPRCDGTLLVIDDEESVRSVARRMLEEFGFKVVTAEDGLAGIEVYREHADRLDGVILDITMPQMSGEDALRQLQRIRSDIPIILSSGYSERDVESRFEGEGPAGFIQKPYTSGGLIEKVREVLADVTRRQHGQRSALRPPATEPPSEASSNGSSSTA